MTTTSDLLICGILLWNRVRGFGFAGDRVHELQLGAGIGELGRVEMFQQVCDYAVGTRVRHWMDLYTQYSLLQISLPPEKAYTPFLLLEKATIDALKTDKSDSINFTFSVGSTRRNVQLLAVLVDDMTDNMRGTFRSTDRNAVVEVHVSAGMRGARCKGGGLLPADYSWSCQYPHREI